MRWGLLAAALGLLIPAAGWGAPVQFDFVDGSILVTADVDGAPVGSGNLALDGDFFTFDEGPPADFVDLRFTATQQGPLDITLPAPFPDFDSLTLNSLEVTMPPGGFNFESVTENQDGSFSFVVTPLDISGKATLWDSTGVLAPAMDSFAFQATSFTGTLEIGASGIAELVGIELGTLDVDGAGPLPGITLKGDVTFTGVPEPGSLLLLGAATPWLVRRARARLPRS